MSRKSIYFLLILCIKGAVSNSCETHKSCDECIRDSSVCVWCAAVNINRTRCLPATSDVTWCSDSLENPLSSAKPISNLDFSSKSGALTQIKPQTYHLNLRPGQPLDFQFSFKGVQDYPVDLYFLFDASYTMNKLRTDTALQAKNIYNAMLSMTRDVFMGVGTFVDKNTLPYTLKVVENASYSFRHHLSLGSNYTQFQEAVTNTPLGSNRDLPEGSLDALAQALACKDQIGWRNESRKILVLLTDGYYHAAGDGKSGGIFSPYDGECYTENGIYTKELEMDYPSVSMINKLARNNKVIVIFVVPYDKSSVFDSLSMSITGSKMMLLKKNGNNSDIAPRLKEIYEDITRKIKLNVNIKSPGRPKHFEISFDPDCTQENGACDVTGRENNFKQFNAIIKLLKYDDYDKTEIDVTMDGIDEKLTLNVNIIKDCACQKKAELISEHCNKNKLECGTCMCTEPRFGDRCQCTRNTLNKANDNTACMYNETICNKRGTCSCGVCTDCQLGFVGPYCQCLLSACPLFNGKPCGGRGTCQCDRTCVCHQGFSGKACECSKTDLDCTGPDRKVCNNRGKCECGSCNCDKIGDWDKRKAYDEFCIIKPCPECHNQQCESLTQCALCLLNGNENCACPEHHNYTIVDKLPEIKNDSDWEVCTNVRIDVGCYTNYTYMYNEDVYGIRLMLQKEKDCAMSYYLYGGIFLASLLLIGILTLVGWKVCTDYRDKQEYKKFLEDHKSEISPCENPLYVPAQTYFRNPAFRKRSVQ